MIKKTIFNFLNRKKNNIFILSIGMIFLIVINITYFYLHLTANINTNDYAFNELFINYQAGFIRRGLLGEIFWNLNIFFEIKPIVFFSYLFLSLYLMQIYFFYKVFEKYRQSIFIYLLIFFLFKKLNIIFSIIIF